MNINPGGAMTPVRPRVEHPDPVSLLLTPENIEIAAALLAGTALQINHHGAARFALEFDPARSRSFQTVAYVGDYVVHHPSRDGALLHDIEILSAVAYVEKYEEAVDGSADALDTAVRAELDGDVAGWALAVELASTGAVVMLRADGTSHPHAVGILAAARDRQAVA